MTISIPELMASSGARGLARHWAASGKFDALVYADGHSDRPLVSDERGEWLRGDVAGILCARFLGADSVSTPVSCNTAVEKCGWFATFRRTRIGSPYVIASMCQASRDGAKTVVGSEANGGFLLNSDVALGGKRLRALPPRDAVILMLGILLAAPRSEKKFPRSWLNCRRVSPRATACEVFQRKTAAAFLRSSPLAAKLPIVLPSKPSLTNSGRKYCALTAPTACASLLPTRKLSICARPAMRRNSVATRKPPRTTASLRSTAPYWGV